MRVGKKGRLLEIYPENKGRDYYLPRFFLEFALKRAKNEIQGHSQLNDTKHGGGAAEGHPPTILIIFLGFCPGLHSWAKKILGK